MKYTDCPGFGFFSPRISAEPGISILTNYCTHTAISKQKEDKTQTVHEMRQLATVKQTLWFYLI